MGIVIENQGDWTFKCEGGTGWFTGQTEEDYQYLELEVKKVIIDAGYLNENNTLNTNFIK